LETGREGMVKRGGAWRESEIRGAERVKSFELDLTIKIEVMVKRRFSNFRSTLAELWFTLPQN